jgi:hypothetical protein
MKKITSILLIFTLIVVSSFKPMDGNEDVNAKFKSIMLFGFASKYVEWPAKYKEGDFIFGLFGESQSLRNNIESMVSQKKIGLQNGVVKSFDDVSKITDCHILYVAPESSDKINKIIAKLKGKNTLIITEKAGLAKEGAAINFVVIDNKVKFELNELNANKYDLKVSTALAQIAIPVK